MSKENDLQRTLKQDKSTVSTILENVTFSIDGQHIIYTIYNILKSAEKSVYISIVNINWQTILNEENEITFAQLIIFLCNVKNISIYILIGENILIDQRVPEEILSLKNCSIKFIPQFGPTIQEESYLLNPSVVQWIESRPFLSSFKEFIDNSLNKFPDKGVFHHNQSYILVDSKHFFIGSLEINETLAGFIEHVDHFENSQKHSNSEAIEYLTDKTLQNSIHPDTTKSNFMEEESTSSSPNLKNHIAGNAENKIISASSFKSWFSNWSTLNSMVCCHSLSDYPHDNLNNSDKQVNLIDNNQMIDDNILNAFDDDLNTVHTETNSNDSDYTNEKIGATNSGYNVENIVYHRVGILIYPSKFILNFVHNNWKYDGSFIPENNQFSNLYLTGNFITQSQNHSQSELETLLGWVKTSKESLYIETPHLNSTSKTANKIIEAVVSRLIEAEKNNDSFIAIILCNANNYACNELSQIPLTFSALHVEHTAEYILQLFNSKGYNPSRFKNRLFIGFLSNKTQYIQIKSTVVIQDSKKALFTSSSFTDRSLSHKSGKQRGNIELGIVIDHPQRVSELQEFLWKDHLQYCHRKLNNTVNLVEFFQACKKGQGNIRPLKLNQKILSEEDKNINNNNQVKKYALQCLTTFLGKNIEQ